MKSVSECPLYTLVGINGLSVGAGVENVEDRMAGPMLVPFFWSRRSVASRSRANECE